MAVLFGAALLVGVNAIYLIDVNQINLPPINLVMTIFGLFLVYAGINSWGGGDDDENEDFSEILPNTSINASTKILTKGVFDLAE